MTLASVLKRIGQPLGLLVLLLCGLYLIELSTYPSQALAAGIIYVDADAAGANDGSSWANAYTDLQDALTAATDGDEIWVAEGTYKPTDGITRTISFELKNGVGLYGGFSGTEIAREERSPEANVTILSGDLNGDDNDNVDPDEATRAENSYHVVNGSDTDSSAYLSGFTITGGNANDVHPYIRGGGMFNVDGNPTISDVIFRHNSATSSGGGMYNNNSHPTVTHVTFTGNSAFSYGSGMFNNNSNPIVTNVTFIGNLGSSYGGGMYNNDNSQPVISNVTFIANSASSSGGGMYSYQSSPTVSQATFENNSAPQGGGMSNFTNSNAEISDVIFTNNHAKKGGAVFNAGSNPTFTNVTFSHNSAFRDASDNGSGAGMWNHTSNVRLNFVTFINNSADSLGGGLYNTVNSSPIVSNAVFMGNSADLGGAIFNNSSSTPTFVNVMIAGNSANSHGGGIGNWHGSMPSLSHVTITGNLANQNGGGIYLYNDTSVMVSNSILWNNQDSGGTDATAQLDDQSSGTPTITYSIVQGGWSGTGNRANNPLFISPISPNNAPTTAGDFHLQPTSPAIDAGDNSAVPTDTLDLDNDSDINEPLPFDLDGSPRFQDAAKADTGNGSAPIVDMGAYEQNAIIYVKADATGANNGRSWADAYTDLQDALAVAIVGDEIWVAAGTYKPTDDGNRAISFHLKNGVGIYGGFSGTETNRTQRNVSTNPTILTGDLDGDDNDNVAHDEPTRDENSYHVLRGIDLDHTAVLDGFTITGANGNVSGGTSDDSGGMRNDRSSPTLSNLIFTKNSVLLHAGGMGNVEESHPTLTNVTFSQNVAGGQGGAMYNTLGSNPLLRNVRFIENTAADDGGAMYNSGSNPTLIDVIFRDNSAVDDGGGMLNNHNSQPTLKNVTFSGNSAHDGGGILNANSNPTLTNVTFSGNSASYGGGMHDYTSASTLSNVTFTGNSATIGGGMYNNDSSPTISHVTFTGNSATNEGGAIANAGSSSPALTNSILWNNQDSAGTIASSQISGGTPTVSYSLVQGGFAGTGNIDADPLFISPTDLHLQPTSPAIDAGDNLTLPADTADLDGDGDTSEALPLDLDGQERVTDSPLVADTGNGSAPLVDMGAYEYQAPSLTLMTPNSAVANAGNVPIVIEGQQLQAPITAQLGGFELLSVTLETDNTLHAVVPVASLSEGVHDLTVDSHGYPLTLTDAFTVMPEQEKKQFRVMVYLACDNNLKKYCLDLFDKLEVAMVNNPNLYIVAFWDGEQEGDSAYYLIQPDEDPDIWADYTDDVNRFPLGEVDSASHRTLIKFTAWAQAHYPGDYKFLSLVGHGGGWAPDLFPDQGAGYAWGGDGEHDKVGGMLWDDHSGDDSRTVMPTHKMARALERVNQAAPLDVLYLDACLMGTVEVMAELAEYAHYFVTHENMTWAVYPYDKYFAEVEADTSPETLARRIAQINHESRPDVGHPSQAGVIDSSELDNLLTKLDVLAIALSDTLTSNADLQPVIRELVLQSAFVNENGDFSLNSDDSAIDLHDFAAQLITSPQIPEQVKHAAQEVQAAIGTVVVANHTESGTPWKDGAEYWELDNLHGLSIYFPLTHDEWKRAYYGADALPRFAEATAWDEFIRDVWYAGRAAPPPEECDDCVLPSPMHIALTLGEPQTGQVGDPVWVPVWIDGIEEDDALSIVEVTVQVANTIALAPAHDLLPQLGDFLPAGSQIISGTLSSNGNGWDVTITIPDASEVISGTGVMVEVPFYAQAAGCPTLHFATHRLTNRSQHALNHYQRGVEVCAEEEEANSARLLLSPPTVTTGVGDTFELTIMVEAGAELVNGASAYLNFDSLLLQVEEIIAGDSLSAVLQNEYDNANGQINFAAGTLDDGVSGTFTLATVVFTTIAESDETPIVFSTTSPRQSDVTSNGESILGETAGSIVTIHNSILFCSVSLEGRGNDEPPHSRWSIPLDVSLTIPGESEPTYQFTPTTDDYGTFTIAGFVPGSYELRVKNSHTLQNMLLVDLLAGTTPLHCGTLREGDANNDNSVSILDFSILASSFSKCEGTAGYDERADFNEDNCVTIRDFSLLAANFGQAGNAASSRHADEIATGDAKLIIDSPVLNVTQVGQLFSVTVQVEADMPIDAAAAYFDFDESRLKVKGITAGDTFTSVLQKEFDNEQGTISFAAGILEEKVSGTFDLLEIELEGIELGESPLSFHFTSPRQTDITANGYSVMSSDDTPATAVQLSQLAASSPHPSPRAIIGEGVQRLVLLLMGLLIVGMVWRRRTT